VITTCAFAGTVLSAPSPSKPLPYTISGWKEVVICVRDMDAYNVFFAELADWRLLEQGPVSAAQLSAWQLDKSASAEHRLYANPGTDSGFIRLVQFNGIEQKLIRPDSQSWDTGGIFDINMRALDLNALAPALRAQGWQARSPITQFSFGPFVVKEWIPQTSDGFAIAFIQRIKPARVRWPHLKSLSRSFNSTQVVHDMPRSLEFYEGVLGFKRYLEHVGASDRPGPNVLGLPHNMTDKVPRSVYVLHPQALNEGSIELLSFEGALGRNNSERANLPNIGIALLSFPVAGIDALQERLKQHGIEFVHKLRVIDGTRKLIVKAPEGAWLEFYEQN
jgi:catechol 2,3-dioxygenase-like lactoylglutathione lyase family enzyme